MTVTFLFTGTTKIILTCDSKKDEMLMQLARDAGPATVTYKNGNGMEILFSGPTPVSTKEPANVTTKE